MAVPAKRVAPRFRYRDAIWHSDLSTAEKIVLLCYESFAHGEPLQAYVTRSQVVSRCSLGARTVDRIRPALVEKGWLAPLHPTEGHEQITVYELKIPTGATTALVSDAEPAPPRRWTSATTAETSAKSDGNQRHHGAL